MTDSYRIWLGHTKGALVAGFWHKVELRTIWIPVVAKEVGLHNKGGFVATWVGVWCNVCCDGNMIRGSPLLKASLATMVSIRSVLMATGVNWRRLLCCGCNRGWLRNTAWLLWALSSELVTKSVVIVIWIDWGPQGFCGGYRGWFTTTKVTFVQPLLG